MITVLAIACGVLMIVVAVLSRLLTVERADHWITRKRLHVELAANSDGPMARLLRWHSVGDEMRTTGITSDTICGPLRWSVRLGVFGNNQDSSQRFDGETALVALKLAADAVAKVTT